MKLNEISYESNKGIFETMASLTDFDLWDATAGAYMDIEYELRFSGEKPAAPILVKMLDDDNILSTTDENKIVNLLYAKYHRAWEQYKKYDESDYDVWDDVEKITKTKTGSDTQTPEDWVTTSEGLAADNYSEVDSSTYGFNSSSAVPADKTESKTNSKISTEQSGTLATVYDTEEVTEMKGSSKLRTGAEMMEFDERFWTRWNFVDAVFKDCDKILTCPYYE